MMKLLQTMKNSLWILLIELILIVTNKFLTAMRMQIVYTDAKIKKRNEQDETNKGEKNDDMVKKNMENKENRKPRKEKKYLRTTCWG